VRPCTWGPLQNPADRDHCLQYCVAVALLYGTLTVGSDGIFRNVVSVWAEFPHFSEYSTELSAESREYGIKV